MLTTDEGREDLAFVQNLMTEHQLVEADIIAHEACISNPANILKRPFEGHVSGSGRGNNGIKSFQ